MSLPAWVIIVPTICGTIVILAAMILIWRVYKRGGAKDAREVARAIVELRPASLIATAVLQRRSQAPRSDQRKLR